jgi:hypothetical protein
VKYLDGYCKCGDWSDKIHPETRLCESCQDWSTRLAKRRNGNKKKRPTVYTVDGRCRACHRVTCVCYAEIGR